MFVDELNERQILMKSQYYEHIPIKKNNNANVQPQAIGIKAIRQRADLSFIHE